MKRDREVRGGRQGCRKSVKTGQEKRVWVGGRLLRGDPGGSTSGGLQSFRYASLNGGFKPAWSANTQWEKLRWGFLVDFLLFLPPPWGSCFPPFLFKQFGNSFTYACIILVIYVNICTEYFFNCLNVVCFMTGEKKISSGFFFFSQLI